jgi:hypothetical protein
VGLFRQKRAEPLAEQARTELRATGEKPARDTTGNLRSLTAQVQVALIVAQGITNREAAAALFLSAKRSSSILATLTANSASGPVPSSYAELRTSTKY